MPLSEELENLNPCLGFGCDTIFDVDVTQGVGPAIFSTKEKLPKLLSDRPEIQL